MKVINEILHEKFTEDEDRVYKIFTGLNEYKLVKKKPAYLVDKQEGKKFVKHLGKECLDLDAHLIKDQISKVDHLYEYMIENVEQTAEAET